MSPQRFGMEFHELLTATVFSALGGIVKQIVFPEHQVGILGFSFAATTGVFSGWCTGLAARAGGASADVFLICCGVGSVLGFSFLQAVMLWIHGRQHGKSFTFTGPTSVGQLGDHNTNFEDVDAKNLQTGDQSEVKE